jgi:hypothetical protein
MPDAMTNGGFAPYLAQAFTPQGVAGGLFGSGVGNVPGNIFGNPTFDQGYGLTGYGLTGGGVPGGVSPFIGMPAIGQQFQPSIGWQQPWQQQVPQFLQGNPFGQFAGQSGAGLGWPNAQLQPYAQLQAWGQVQPWQNIGQIGTHQLGQPFAQLATPWQEPLVLAQLLRQYALPISAVMTSPYGQAHMAQHLVQTAELLTRILPLVGAPQLTPIANLLGQYAVPISAAIASPYGQTQIAQNIAQTAEMLGRVLPVVCAQQQSHAQPNIGWQPQLMPQLPVASLLGQHQQYLPQQTSLGSFGGLYGQGQLGQFSGQSGDTLGRILPYLAQQGLAGQPYGMARV